MPDDEEEAAESSEPDAELWETNRFLVPQFDGRPRAIRTRLCD